MRSRHSAFTLVEVLVVFGLISTLSVTAVIVVNPTELFARARDTERMNEVQSINRALQYGDLYNLSEGTAQTVYISLPDTSPTCASFSLPSLASGWTYACASAANYQKTNGTGWIPVNLASTGIGILEVLPTDPINTAAGNYYYTYTPGGSWVLTAGLESAKHLAEAASNDRGTDATRFEVGTDIDLWSQSGAAAMAVSSVSPTSGSRGTTLTLTVSGSGFTSDAVVTLSGTRITVNSTTFVNSTQVTATITIESNAQKTERDVTVTTAAGSATCSGCFTVTN